MSISRAYGHEADQEINWDQYAGQRCDFLRPYVVSAVIRPDEIHAWEQGVIKGTNGKSGVLGAVEISDLVGNKVLIPLSIAVSSIILIGEGHFKL